MSEANDLLVCRRVEDTQGVQDKEAECVSCKAKVYVEGGADQPESKICIHCAAKDHPSLVLFVELRPDEFGARSIPKTVREVYEADGGKWHKHGVWHNQKWVFERME